MINLLPFQSTSSNIPTNMQSLSMDIFIQSHLVVNIDLLYSYNQSFRLVDFFFTYFKTLEILEIP